MRSPTRNIQQSRLSCLGISLVEILTAMAIVAVLTAVLTPAINRMRDKSYAAKCQGNLREIGNAFALYRAENNNEIPKAYDATTTQYWFHKLQAAGVLTDARVLACPASTNRTTMWGITPPTPVNYGMLDSIIWYPTSHRSQEEPKLWMRVGQLSNWPVVMDADKMVVYSLDNPTTTAAADSRFAARHGGRANVLMADGHVETAAAGETRWRQQVLNDNTHLPR